MNTTVTLTWSFERDPKNIKDAPDFGDDLFDLKCRLMEHNVDFSEIWFQDGKICAYSMMDWFKETLGDSAFEGTPYEMDYVNGVVRNPELQS